MSIRTTSLRRAAVAPLLLVLALAAGCGSDEESPAAPAPTTAPASEKASEPPSEPAPEPSEPEAPEGTTIEVTIEGDRITPSGERVEVAAGETVTFHVTSDRAGEMHVHSAPEQELAYGAGETDLEVTIDRPGVVEVEDHDAGLVIVQLQVS